MTVNNPDFTSANRGSIILLNAHSESAADWLKRNTDADAWSVPIDHRMFFDIACSLLTDGFTLCDLDTGRMAQLPD